MLVDWLKKENEMDYTHNNRKTEDRTNSNSASSEWDFTLRVPRVVSVNWGRTQQWALTCSHNAEGLSVFQYTRLCGGFVVTMASGTRLDFVTTRVVILGRFCNHLYALMNLSFTITTLDMWHVPRCPSLSHNESGVSQRTLVTNQPYELIAPVTVSAPKFAAKYSRI